MRHSNGFGGQVRIATLEQLDARGSSDAFAFYNVVRKGLKGVMPMRESTFDDILESMGQKGYLELSCTTQDGQWSVSITDEGRNLLKLYREKAQSNQTR